MGYSEEAIAFSVIPAGEQVRFEDRVSFLYVDQCLVRQDRTGVVALRRSEGDTAEEDEQVLLSRIQIPVAGLAVLCLGPGTSISSAALTSCTRSGCTVIFSGANGVNAYSHATPLTSSARWAIAQTRLIASEDFQKQAAVQLYKRQFGLEDMPGSNIEAMRGMEGRLMRNAYRNEAKKARIRGFRRDTHAKDPVNVGLNIANSIMYGLAATACTTLGVNPALGIIHRGDIRALLYDLADLYNANTVIPLVFSHAHDEDPVTAIRKGLRVEIRRKRILEGMLDALMDVLRVHLPERDDDRLIGDDEQVPGHVQYGQDS